MSDSPDQLDSIEPVVVRGDRSLAAAVLLFGLGIVGFTTALENVFEFRMCGVSVTAPLFLVFGWGVWHRRSDARLAGALLVLLLLVGPLIGAGWVFVQRGSEGVLEWVAGMPTRKASVDVELTRAGAIRAVHGVTLLLLLLPGTAAACRAASLRRVRPCPVCGYNLASLDEAEPCPWCTKAVPTETPGGG